MTLRFLNLIITVPHPITRTLEAVGKTSKTCGVVGFLCGSSSKASTAKQPTKVHCENAILAKLCRLRVSEKKLVVPKGTCDLYINTCHTHTLRHPNSPLLLHNYLAIGRVWKCCNLETKADVGRATALLYVKTSHRGL